MKHSKFGILLAFVLLATTFPGMDTWTRETSDGGYPLACPTGKMVTGFGCSGDYCDNVSLRCSTDKFDLSQRWWEEPISEENRSGSITDNGITTRNNDNMQRCGTWGFITGVSCSGEFCDNVALECSGLQGKRPNSCGWSGWMSEENRGRSLFPEGRYPVAMECSGPYCDNKRFLLCSLADE